MEAPLSDKKPLPNSQAKAQQPARAELLERMTKATPPMAMDEALKKEADKP